MTHIADMVREGDIVVLYDAAGNRLGSGATLLHAVANMYGHEYEAPWTERGAMPGVRRAPSGRWEARFRNRWLGVYDTAEDADEAVRQCRAKVKRDKAG